MQSERLGIVTFFGILVPGTYLAATVVLSLSSVFELLGYNGHAETYNFLHENIALSASAFFFVSYLFGVVLRLFAPHNVDKLARLYLVHIRRNKDDWVKDIFPYKNSLAVRFEKDGMHKMSSFMECLNDRHGVPDNTVFFNYCKLFVDANDEALSKQVHQAEALMRFLSGTALALLGAIIAFFVLSFVAFLIDSTHTYSVIYLSLAIVSMLILCFILERFKHQRRREVIIVWSALHLILNGAVPGAVLKNKNVLIEAAFFPKQCGGDPGSMADKDQETAAVEKLYIKPVEKSRLDDFD